LLGLEMRVKNEKGEMKKKIKKKGKMKKKLKKIKTFQTLVRQRFEQVFTKQI